MTNVAFRLGKVHALGDVVVLDVNTYDVLFGLPALVALRENLDFERRSIVLRNTGGKPYAVPMRLTLRTTINGVPRVSPMMAGTLRMISWDESAEGKSSTDDADSSDEDDPEILKLARQRAFATLKDALATTPILIRPDPSKQFILITAGSYFRYSSAEEEAEEESEGELRREAREATARLAEDEEKEREAEEESAEAEEEEEEAEEETSEEEEEAYSEYSEGEQSEEEDEDDEEVESRDDQEPTHDELEWVPGPDRREENPEAAAQRKKEIAEGKRLAIDPAPNDPFKDPEPPKPEHGDLAATTSGAATTRRRSRSRSTSPSASARPPIRQRVNEGLSPSSPIHIPPSP
ncbi:hypothetical protein CBR_g41559 [Chara braunii]|uniref:Uncharacterized protein n=1 Tax=Chara braunii TaxID=69332 RepID=A0A388K2X6_CHABU|nr:hypothetical protein CBR_g41559 [Chara braunii]|eukprot:GBG64359.1 hypothetical protein CBR_g41559 [Chara braunii]